MKANSAELVAIEPAATRIIASNLPISGMSTGQHPLTREQEAQLQDDLAAVEELLQANALLMRARYGEDSQVSIRADEMLCALQRFDWELDSFFATLARRVRPPARCARQAVWKWNGWTGREISRTPLPLLPGGCLAMRRDTFEAIGGFDAAAIRCGPCAEWCPVHVITMEAYHLLLKVAPSAGMSPPWV